MDEGESSALNLIHSYESSSDSERDSGYTSEDDKKRKLDQESHAEHRSYKRRCIEECSKDENMIVDSLDHCCRLSPNERLEPSRLLADRSTSSGCAQGSKSSQSKSTGLIPLPKELALEGPSHIDESSKHQGRVRSFPHDPGNWASVVYLPLDVSTSAGVGITSYDTLQSLVAEVENICYGHGLHLTPSSDFHISLSKTLLIRLHMIQPLAHDIRAALSNVASFSVWLNRFEVYVNEEKSRTFLGLRVLHGHNELAAVVNRLDRILGTYTLPTFYRDCSLHASVAWVLGDKSVEMRRLLPLLEDHFAEYFAGDDHLRSFQARHLHFKAGNRIHSIQLGPHGT